MKSIFILLAASLLVTGCATTKKADQGITPPVIVEPEVPVTPEPTPEPEPEPIVYKADWDGNPRGKEFTDFTLSGLEVYGQRMLNLSAPKDAAKYCPKFSTLTYDQKKQVYLMLISAMAKRESNFKPETNYTESFTDSKGNKVISRGLLQISQESANQNAYRCAITKATQLNDAKTNLYCGVKILDFQLAKDNRIGQSISSSEHRGCGRYWSVCRSWPDGQKESQKYVRSKVMALDICK